ncbi:DNA-binding transcriptional regulator, MarR family [Paracoccus aminovorans]|uniref:DNA-binding transcriptional regulator, MarR family n=1 Tax=Paracoccus aminovorans TaxID=34004 RepID=A0A1I3DSY4_9RHOB|nr:MarR family winged helix-turn-helix transcriptional regulator [Paracoccus aminovorans]CQR86946.1 MarR family transcriptional regulator [Paracoccus aminovorans]SFH89857.1 DNA-binding transcriptional regulator, MarR family [Paracoccus aminovorans]
MTFDLDSFLPYRLAVAAAQVSDRFSHLYAAEAGLTIPEWRVLAHLHGQEGVSVRDITRRVNLEKSVVSRAASRLERDGLLEKTDNKDDRRLVALRLTSQGRALMDRLGRLALSFQKQLLQELGADAETFSRVLDRLSAPVDVSR